jgi:hypothetical protein
MSGTTPKLEIRPRTLHKREQLVTFLKHKRIWDLFVVETSTECTEKLILRKKRVIGYRSG